jgi:predicted dinucleotide-binding enzyme
LTVIDATNPLGPGLKLLTGKNGESGGEQVQAMVPQAHVVKALNTTGFDNMQNPVYEGRASVMFYCGDDAGAKSTVKELLVSLGFEAVDAGPLSRARQLENLAVLWISLAMGGLGRDIAFRLMRR